MGISRFFDTTFDIYRSTTVSSYRISYQDTGDNVDGHLQEITDEHEMVAYGDELSTHKCWIAADNANVVLYDQLRDGNTKYKVVAIYTKNYGFAGNSVHKELFLKLKIN